MIITIPDDLVAACDRYNAQPDPTTVPAAQREAARLQSLNLVAFIGERVAALVHVHRETDKEAESANG